MSSLSTASRTVLPEYVIYSDLNQVNTDGSESLVFDLADIKQHIEQILFTRTREIPFNRGNGNDIDYLLFDKVNSDSALMIYNESIVLIESEEERVKVDFGKTTIIPNEEKQRYDVTIACRPYGLYDNAFVVHGVLNRKNKAL